MQSLKKEMRNASSRRERKKERILNINNQLHKGDWTSLWNLESHLKRNTLTLLKYKINFTLLIQTVEIKRIKLI